MYGDPEARDSKAELELEQERMKHDHEIMKLEIQNEIDTAKIDQEAKNHIRHMARCPGVIFHSYNRLEYLVKTVQAVGLSH